MSLWRDEKYLRLLSPQLERFHQKKPQTYNFRCPLCGDSEKHRSKARGYVYPHGADLLFKCHNCSVALPFAALLKKLSPVLFGEYLLEKTKEDALSRPAPEPVAVAPERPVARPDATWPVYPLDDVPASLKSATDYILGRKVPISALPRFYATERAQTWLTPLVGEEKAQKVKDGTAYLIQPLTLPDATWYGAQLRMLERKEYTTFRWAADPLKIFGLDKWSGESLTYVCEGPIDSVFIPNCISVCGSDLLTGVRVLEDKDILSRLAPRVYVWDNEPRNKEIVRHLRTAIRLNERVVIWPKTFPKDINDMVRADINVLAALPRRTYQGLLAELELTAWLK